MAALPLPDGPLNSDGLTAPLTVGYSDPTSLDAYSLRIDHTINQHLSLFGRYNHAPSAEWIRSWSQDANFTANADSATIGATFVSISGLVNDFRGNWSRDTGGHTCVMDTFHGAVPPPDSAITRRATAVKQASSDSEPPGTDGEVKSGPQEANVQRQLNFIDNFAVTARAHQLKFGADFRHLNPTTNTNNYDLLMEANDLRQSAGGNCGLGLHYRRRLNHLCY